MVRLIRLGKAPVVYLFGVMKVNTILVETY